MRIWLVVLIVVAAAGLGLLSGYLIWKDRVSEEDLEKVIVPANNNQDPE